MWNRWVLLGVLGIVLLVGMAGCGDGGVASRAVLVGEGAGDVGELLDLGVREPTGNDVAEDSCEGSSGCGDEADEVLSSCDLAFDLGVLVAGQLATAEVDVASERSWLTTQCSVGGGSAEAVFHLRVDVPMRLSFEIESIDNFDVVMELRAGDCHADETVQFCSNSAMQDFIAEADVDYYLVVEARQDVAMPPFTLKVRADSAVCAPAGGWRCEGNARVQCFGGVEERTFECADGCESGVCRGDSCENALIVRESTTFTGKTAGYHNNFDFSSEPSCSSSGTVGMRTVGQDIVFYLPELRAGQTVFVDAATGDTNDNVIVVLDTCSIASGCLSASSSGNQLSWKVENNGSYYVVIDKTTATARDFHYRIEINP